MSDSMHACQHIRVLQHVLCFRDARMYITWGDGWSSDISASHRKIEDSPNIKNQAQTEIIEIL